MPFIFLTFFILSAVAQADLRSELVEVQRKGKIKTRVLYNEWSGEEPVPVIDLMSSTQKMVTVKAYRSVTDLSKKQQISCLMDSGLIHPWSENKEVLNYLSLVEQQSYVFLKAFEFKKAVDLDTSQSTSLKVQTDDTIESVIYNSNGVCTFKIITANKKFQVSLDCTLVSDRTIFKPRFDSSDVFKEQWIEFNCYQKNQDIPQKAYIRDIDLLKIPQVQVGCVAKGQKVFSASDCPKSSGLKK